MTYEVSCRSESNIALLESNAGTLLASSAPFPPAAMKRSASGHSMIGGHPAHVPASGFHVMKSEPNLAHAAIPTAKFHGGSTFKRGLSAPLASQRGRIHPVLRGASFSVPPARGHPLPLQGESAVSGHGSYVYLARPGGGSFCLAPPSHPSAAASPYSAAGDISSTIGSTVSAAAAAAAAAAAVLQLPAAADDVVRAWQPRCTELASLAVQEPKMLDAHMRFDNSAGLQTVYPAAHAQQQQDTLLSLSKPLPRLLSFPQHFMLPDLNAAADHLNPHHNPPMLDDDNLLDVFAWPSAAASAPCMGAAAALAASAAAVSRPALAQAASAVPYPKDASSEDDPLLFLMDIGLQHTADYQNHTWIQQQVWEAYGSPVENPPTQPQPSHASSGSMDGADSIMMATFNDVWRNR